MIDDPADLAATAQFETTAELTDDELVAFLKLPGGAQYVTFDTVDDGIEGTGSATEGAQQ